ncbi:MAG: undecaprenyl-diphosphate phosphatase, partial [Oscillospiraceae bacterium]|nr:undecaprenyl-diphosphate phosphatase [Oscillospiraceae bacterium]
MEILKAILLGFLQGVTEFLPISSSGHLSVFQHFFGNVSGTSSLLFTVLLHMGTLIAVFVVYYKTIWGLIVEFFSTIKDIFTGKFKWSEMNENRRMLFMFVISCVPLLFLLIPVGGDRRIMDVLGGLADD